MAGEFDGVLHAEATATRGRSLTSWVFGDGAPSAGTAGVSMPSGVAPSEARASCDGDNAPRHSLPASVASSSGYTWTAADSERVAALRKWATTTLSCASSPFMSQRFAARSLASMRPPAAALPPNDRVDVLARLDGLGEATASVSGSASPEATGEALRAHSIGGARPQPFLFVVDPSDPRGSSGGSSGSGGAQMRVGVWFDGGMSVAVAAEVCLHLRSHAAAGAYSCGWARLRNVRVRRGVPAGPSGAWDARLGLVVDGLSSLMKLPDYYAGLTGELTHLSSPTCQLPDHHLGLPYPSWPHPHPQNWLEPIPPQVRIILQRGRPRRIRRRTT